MKQPPPYRFDLVWPQGRGRLELPAAAPRDPHAVQAALALAPALPRLTLLEQWVGATLIDLRPSLEDATWPDACVAATFGWEAGGRLALPWGVLPWGCSAPAQLPLRWPAWPVRLLLQTLPAGRVPRARLTEGALLLLPATFNAGGRELALHAPTDGPPLPPLQGLFWCPRTGRLGLEGARPAPVAPAPRSGEARVWLAEAPPIEARAWFGGAVGPLQAPAAAAVLELDGRPCAAGAMLPAGQGWAVRIERLTDEANGGASSWT